MSQGSDAAGFVIPELPEREIKFAGVPFRSDRHPVQAG